MVSSAYDVVAVGNAIVDVLVTAPDALLTDLGLVKGVMTLVDAETSESIYRRLPPGRECSGGSAANSAAGIASLGGRAAFIGKVKTDQLGAVFRHDLTSQGVAFPTADTQAGPPTARCLVVVTPDAQRTMQTYLGACVDLTPDDIDPALIGSAQVTYLEGYLWDPPAAKLAFKKAAASAHAAGRKVALSLSDPFCVERHRAEFLALIEDDVDILFANQAELESLFQTGLEQAVSAIRGKVAMAAITRGEQGSMVVEKDKVTTIAAEPLQRLVDTTGAGDLYAAGFLFGLTSGRDAAQCARLGGICAAEIIGHVGSRPETNLARLIAGAVLLPV